MPTPLVSIITPVYNGATYLAQALDSAIKQSYDNWELIVVNDGSIDNSESIIENYLPDPRILYIKQQNQGVAAARNTAIAAASGTYIGFLDQDDRWHKDKLSIQIAALESDKTIALVYARQNIINENEVPIEYPWPTGAIGHCLKTMFLRNQITILTTLVRKQVLNEVGAFNEKLSGTDDYDMWLRICLSHPIGFIDKTLADYRVHSSNVSNDDFKMTALDLKTIESVLLAHPEIYDLLGKQVVYSRLHQLHRELGGWLSWKKNDFKQARNHYAKAIYFKPLSFRPYYRWVYCSLGNKQRRAAHWYIRKIKDIFNK